MANIGETADMLYLFVVAFVAIALRFRHRRTCVILCFATLLSACAVGGSSTLPLLHIPQEQVREICWEPPNPEGDDDPTDTTDTGDVGKFFVLINGKDVIYSKNRWGFAGAVRQGGFIYKYVESAPIDNLRLLPLSQTDAWCSRIPKPTDETVLRWLTPSSEPTAIAESPPAAKNLIGQTESVPIRSRFFCSQEPQMAPTTADTISLFRRNIAVCH